MHCCDYSGILLSGLPYDEVYRPLRLRRRILASDDDGGQWKYAPMRKLMADTEAALFASIDIWGVIATCLGAGVH